MTLKVTDLVGSTGGSTDTETTDDSDSDADELAEACEAIGANLEAARSYVKQHGNEDELVEFAQELAGNDDLWALQEEYRRLHDQHRMNLNYLRDADEEFTTWTNGFYYGDGDNDNPGEGSYNAIQRASRDAGGNLAFYRALFPEPREDFWDREPVLWCERPNDDSHIYVSQSFVEEYAQFGSLEVDGEARPRPPSNAEIESLQNHLDGGDSDTSDAPFDPRERTVSDIRETLGANDYSRSELEAMLDMEKAKESGRGPRKGAKNAIRDAIDASESSGDSGSDSDTEQTKLGDISGMTPDKLLELRDDGWTKEEILELFA